MEIETDTLQLSDNQIIARTLWAEARSLGRFGMVLTACTILNRAKSGVKWWGVTYRQICLFPWQYSCWNENDPQREKMLEIDENDPLYVIALEIANQLISGDIIDQANGATHYFNHVTVPQKLWPQWALTHAKVFKLEPHWYYRVID